MKWAVGLVALVLTARLAVFMVDPTRSGFSVAPWSSFHRGHSCFTAYMAGAVFARARVDNLYDGDLYDGQIGPLYVDNYEYPPPFLLLPAAANALTPNFFLQRAVWFFLEAALFALALLAVCRFARTSPTLSALVWISPPTLICLQIGNVHLAALALSMLAMIAIARERELLGAGLLALVTACKIYPGILIVVLMVQRRWRAVGYTAAIGLALVAASRLAFGSAPLVEFVRYQIPRIANAEAFPWVEHSDGVFHFNVIATNFSYYGWITKLRQLGLPWMGPATARAFGWIATAGIVGAAIALARRRLQGAAEACAWLTLVNLASLRSSFCPAEYATIGTIWLLALVATRRTAVIVAIAWILLALPWPVEPQAWPHGALRLFWTVAAQVALLAANVWMILRLRSTNSREEWQADHVSSAA